MAKDTGATITNVTIKATADTSSAQRSIRNLAEKLRALKTAVGEGIQLPSAKKIEAFGTAMASLKDVKWTTVSNGMNKVADAMERVATSLGAISSAKGGVSAMRGLSRAVSKATTGTKPVSTAVAKAEPISMGTTTVSGEEVSGELAPSVKESERTTSIFKTLGFSAETAATQTAHLADAIGNALRKGAHNAAVAMGNLLKNMALAPWKRLASSVGGAVKRLTGFLSALKRIAVYRAIRWALKELTKAFKEGMENLYQYSLLINGQFAKSMDSLATSALYAKNSLAAMAAPIVNVLAPAVDSLVDEFVELLNKVNELLAALSGAETWTKAIKYPIAYAEAADDATGSAKKLRATLLGFDEINRLDDNRKGSRGSGKDALDYSKMFEEKTVTTKTKGFIASLKKAFKSSDFTQIGKTLGEKLRDGLDKIPWEDIKTTVNRHATMVGTLLNGLVDVPNLGTSIGKSIAQAFNTAVGKLNTFLTVVQWDKVGKFLADGVNGFLKNFEIEGLGKNFAKIINSGVTLLKNFLSDVEWQKFGEFLGKGINSFFTEVNLKDLGKTISKGIIGALAFVHTFFDTVDFEKVGESIASFFSGLDWTEILAGLTGAIFKGLRAAISALKGMFEENAFVGTVAAIAIANCIAGAFGLPKVTNIISRGLVSLLTDSAASAATSSAANAAASAAAAGSGALGLLGGAAIAVTLAAVAVGAAWTLAKYMHDNDKNLNTKEPYAGAIFDLENDFETYQKKMYNLAHGRDLNTALTASELKDAKRTYTTSKMYNTGADDPFPADMYGSYSNIADAFHMEFNGVGLNDFPKVVTATQNSETLLKDVKSYTKKAYDTLVGGFNISTTGSGTMNSGAKMRANYTYANGGTPDTGSVFLAGESGAELIYSSATGTHVANRDQIAESVAIGNEESNDLLREQNNLLRSLLAKDTTVVTNITTGQITSALDRQNRRSGRAIVPVGG